MKQGRVDSSGNASQEKWELNGKRKSNKFQGCSVLHAQGNLQKEKSNTRTIGDHLFQCEHAWVNMLKSEPEEIPPEGLCTRKRCYQEARETMDEISMSEYYSYLKNSEHLLAEPLRKESSWDSSRHLVGECMTFLRATPQERFRKAMTNGDVCYSCLTKGCPTGKKGGCLNRSWALVCSQCRDEENSMHRSRLGWKPKNVQWAS